MDVDLNYIGFEPSPVEFTCLQKNVPKMSLHNVGLWNTEGTSSFMLHHKEQIQAIRPKTFESKTIVETQPLNKYINGKVKCLKLEAEGAEPEILEGLGDKLTYIEYVTADVGFERGHSQESTLPAVKYSAKQF